MISAAPSRSKVSIASKPLSVFPVRCSLSPTPARHSQPTALLQHRHLIQAKPKALPEVPTALSVSFSKEPVQTSSKPEDLFNSTFRMSPDRVWKPASHTLTSTSAAKTPVLRRPGTALTRRCK